MTRPAKTDAVMIGICTFRRPFLAEALESLAGLALPERAVTVVVADNDDTPTAMPLVAGLAAAHPLELRHIHAPARNISVARNAILAAGRGAGARFLAFVDDDEVVSPGWLAALLRKQAETGAEAVVGPVRAIYSPNAPRWMQRGSVHDTRPDLGPGGIVRQGYTSNVLLDLAAPALQGLQFDPGRGRTGGEDTAFFRDMLRAGGQIAWAPDAVVHEAVPDDRASLRWLLRRRYRMGQTHASLMAQGKGKPVRAAAMAVAASKALACLGIAGARSFDQGGRNRALMRGALHVGAMAELVGLDRIEIYGDGPRMLQDTTPEGAGR